MEVVRNVSYGMYPLEQLSGAAFYFTSLPLHPVFTTVHLILTAFSLRNEPGGVQFAQGHPIASYVMTLIIASSGGLLANFVIARPPVECILDVRFVTTSLIVWYLMFFSPLDVFYGLCHFTPVSLILWTIKELARVKKVYGGVMMAAGVYPQSILAMAVVGMFKGSGKQWGMIWYRAISNPHFQSRHELLGISYTTKSSFVLGLLLAYNHTHPTFDQTHLVLLSGCVFVGLKLWCLQVQNVDPFLSPQSFVWKLLTSVSATHPCRDVGGATKLKLAQSNAKDEDLVAKESKEDEKHLKSD